MRLRMEFKEALREAMREMFELGVENGGDLGVSRDHATDGSDEEFRRQHDGFLTNARAYDNDTRDNMTKICDERIDRLLAGLE